MSRMDESLLARVLAGMDAEMDGRLPADTVPTSFPSLDALLGGGLRRGDLISLGGDAGSGKSALALAVALRAACAGRPAAVLTTEARAERVIERALAIEGRTRVDDLRGGGLDDEARARVGRAALRLRDAPLTVQHLSAAEASAPAEAVPRVPAPAIVVVDALQGLAVGAGPLDEELAAAVRALKALAIARDAAVLLVAHLPAHVRSRADPRPVLADFGVLGAVQQHADIVLALFREEMYAAGPDTAGAAELIILKNRNGPSGYADLYFHERFLRFEDVTEG